MKKPRLYTLRIGYITQTDVEEKIHKKRKNKTT